MFVFVTLLVRSVSFTSSVNSGVEIKLQAGRVRFFTRCLACGQSSLVS